MADAYGGALSFVGAAETRNANSIAETIAEAFGLAKSSQMASQNAFDAATNAESIALESVQNAYADAKGTTQSQQKMIFAILAVAAIAIYSARA